MHEERKTKKKEADVVPDGAVPTYLLDREGQSRAKVLSNMIKQKRKEKAVSRVFFFHVGNILQSRLIIHIIVLEYWMLSYMP